MLLVTVEFELMQDAQSEFDIALQEMRDRVRSNPGFLGETPCERSDGKGYLTAFFGEIGNRCLRGARTLRIALCRNLARKSF